MWGGRVPLGFEGAFLERREEGGEFGKGAVPRAGKGRRGEGHGGGTGAGGHVEGGTIVEKLKGGWVDCSRGGRWGGSDVLLQEG